MEKMEKSFTLENMLFEDSFDLGDINFHLYFDHTMKKQKNSPIMLKFSS